MNFGKLFKSVRRDLGMSQAELAKKLYVTQGMISKVEVGGCDPSAATFIRMYRVVLSADRAVSIRTQTRIHEFFWKGVKT